MNLVSLIADDDVLLSLPPEELAVCVLRVLRWKDGNEGRAPARPANISLTNFCNGEAQQYKGAASEVGSYAIAAAFQHLVNTGMLVPNPHSSPYGWFVLSDRARQLQTPEDYERFREASRYPRGAIHPSIEDLTFAEFLRGDYETAVFKAFKAIEDRVRKLCNYDTAMIGVPMMRRAFDPENGPLTDGSEHKAERESLMHLFAAAIGRFKNPTSHRFTGLDDPVAAIETLQLASLLLRILDQRTPG